MKFIGRTEIKPGVFRECIYTDNLMTAIIDFTNGPWDEPEPPHSHPHEQVSYIAEGEVIFYCEGRPERHLKTGDTFAVDPNLEHTVKVLTKKVRIIDSFTPLRDEFIG